MRIIILKKRILAAALVACMMVVGLVGCGSNNGGSKLSGNLSSVDAKELGELGIEIVADMQGTPVNPDFADIRLQKPVENGVSETARSTRNHQSFSFKN